MGSIIPGTSNKQKIYPLDIDTGIGESSKRKIETTLNQEQVKRGDYRDYTNTNPGSNNNNEIRNGSRAQTGYNNQNNFTIQESFFQEKVDNNSIFNYDTKQSVSQAEFPDFNPFLFNKFEDSDRQKSFLDVMTDIVTGRANIQDVIATQPQIVANIVTLYAGTEKYMSGMLKGADSSSLYNGFVYRTPEDFKGVSLHKYQQDYINLQASQTYYAFSNIIGNDLGRMQRDIYSIAVKYNVIGEGIQGLDIKDQHLLKADITLKNLLLISEVESKLKSQNNSNLIKDGDNITHVILDNKTVVSIEVYKEMIKNVDKKQMAIEVATGTLSNIEEMKGTIKAYEKLLEDFKAGKITKEELINSDIVKELLNSGIDKFLGFNFKTPPSKQDLEKITELLNSSQKFMTDILTILGKGEVEKVFELMSKNKELMQLLSTMQMSSDTINLSYLMGTGVGSLIIGSSILGPIAQATNITPAMAILLGLVNNANDKDAKLLIERLHQLEQDPNYPYFLSLLGIPYKKRFMSKNFENEMEEMFGKQFHMSLIEQSIIGTLLLIGGKIDVNDMYSKKEIEAKYGVEVQLIDGYIKKNNEIKPYTVNPIPTIDEIKKLVVTFMFNNLIGRRKMNKEKAERFFMEELPNDIYLMTKLLTQRPVLDVDVTEWRRLWNGIKMGVQIKWAVKVGDDVVAMIKIGGFEYVLRNNHGSGKVKDTIVYRVTGYDILDAILANSQNVNINKAVKIIREVEIDKQEQMQFFVTDHYEKKAIKYEYQYV